MATIVSNTSNVTVPAESTPGPEATITATWSESLTRVDINGSYNGDIYNSWVLERTPANQTPFWTAIKSGADLGVSFTMSDPLSGGGIQRGNTYTYRLTVTEGGSAP
jgi:hypothetical protein